MTSCSVVMVSYHTGAALFAAVKSVLKQPPLAELILVDNGNPPDVLARLQQMKLTEPRLVVISGHGNAGFAASCNVGAARATGDFILLLNPDCLLSPDALAATTAALKETPKAMLAGGWIKNPNGDEQQGTRRRSLSPMTALSETLGLHRIFKNMPSLNYHTPMPRETHGVEAISSTFMCISRNDYQRLGGMDEGFFLHIEDFDLCMRIRAAGGTVLCVPAAQATRMLHADRAMPRRAALWHETAGLIRYFHKHFGSKIFLPLLWLADAAVWVRFACKTVMNVTAKFIPMPDGGHSVAAKRLMVLASGLADLPQTKDWKGKTVLVTDAASQIGLCVVRRMLAGGASVLALTENEPIPFAHENLRWLRANLGDETMHLHDYLIDIAVHTAPLQALPPILPMLAKAEAKRVVAFGSTSVFGKALSRNAHEKDLVNKLARAENEVVSQCDALAMQWTILRPTMIYGLGLDVNITTMAKIIRRLGFYPVYPPAFGRRQPVHADDLALAVMQLAAAPQSIGKMYNLSGKDVLTYRQMLERIFAVYGLRLRIVPTTLLPFFLDMVGWLPGLRYINGEIARRMNDDLVFFYDDAARDFGFNPRPFLSAGIRDIEGF